MTNSAYLPPSVSITEQVPVNVQPLLETATSIAIIGETLGYLTYSETVFLDDNIEVTLKQSGIDSTTITVVNALDPSATAYVSGTDFVLSSADPTFGTRTLKRQVYTSIPSDADVALIVTLGDATVVTTTGSWEGFDTTIDTSASAVAITNGADRLMTTAGNTTDTTNPVSYSNAAEITTAAVHPLGKYTGGGADYTSTHNSSSSHTITRVGAGIIVSKQTVYVTYEVADGTIYENEAVVLTGTTPQPLANQADDVVAASVIVTNDPTGIAANAETVSAAYTSGATADYLVSAFGAVDDLIIDRNLNSAQGTDLIGYSANSIAVKVRYNATPTDYYQATRFFSQSDVEAKYGAALDSNGNINSPASFGAFMAFLNLASNVVIQPLFHVADVDVPGATRTRPTPTTYVGDWAIALRSLRDLEDVNVIVPCYANTATSGTMTDSKVTTIFAAVMSHIYYMGLQQQYVIGIFGEDSNITGLASQTTLQNHARSTLAGSATPERAALVSPGSFAFANPQSGTQVRIGGQFVAAAISGMLSANAVQAPLTRKPINGVTDVLDFRAETEKNNDAQAGLLVVENRNGIVRVRHGITVAVNDTNTRELSVVRAKNHMIESIRQTIDNQLIGRVIADGNAAFTVTTTIQGVLEALMTEGAIVDYSGLQSRSLAPSQPTTIEVRFSYKPSYPLNYVNVIFSIDTTTGAIDTAPANTNA